MLMSPPGYADKPIPFCTTEIKPKPEEPENGLPLDAYKVYFSIDLDTWVVSVDVVDGLDHLPNNKKDRYAIISQLTAYRTKTIAHAVYASVSQYLFDCIANWFKNSFVHKHVAGQYNHLFGAFLAEVSLPLCIVNCVAR
jgi:hypothetical protein